MTIRVPALCTNRWGECIRRGDRDEIYENLRMHVVGSAEESLETFDAEPTVEK